MVHVREATFLVFRSKVVLSDRAWAHLEDVADFKHNFSRGRDVRIKVMVLVVMWFLDVRQPETALAWNERKQGLNANS